MAHSHPDPRLAELLDRAEITDVLHRLFQGIDRCDEAAIRDAFHSDGTDDHGEIFRGSGAEYAAWCVARLTERWSSTHHVVSNITVDFDGDVAFVEAYVTAAHQRTDGDGTMLYLFGGRDVDRFERRNGKWGIVDRVIVNDWSSYGPVEQHPTIAGYMSGALDRSGVHRRS